MRDGLIIWARLQAVAASLINSGISREQVAWAALEKVESENQFREIPRLTVAERKRREAARAKRRRMEHRQLLQAQRSALDAAKKLSDAIALSDVDQNTRLALARFMALARKAKVSA